MKPQEFLDPPPVGLNRPRGQSPHLASGFVLIEELHAIQCAAQELLGRFARSNSAHPDGPVEVDMRKPSDILNGFDSENQKLGGGEF
jgi:hypothetical protein